MGVPIERGMACQRGSSGPVMVSVPRTVTSFAPGGSLTGAVRGGTGVIG
jgi:hypothetical protein